MMEWRHLMLDGIDDIDGVEECIYADDYKEHAAFPQGGVTLTLHITKPDQIGHFVIMPDAASWSIVKLGVFQGSFSHSGFRGTVSGLLQKVRRDVDMMRGGYPGTEQPKFDAFLSDLDRVVAGEVNAEGVEMMIKDPSGISMVVLGDDDAWVTSKSFERSWYDKKDLGILPPYYAHPGPQMSTPEEIAALVSVARNVCLFSGAGISVDSGIPPFRDPGHSEGKDGSIWGSFDAAKMTVKNFNNVDDLVGAKAWWAMKHSLIPKFVAASPNPAHNFFSRCHTENKLCGVITQNIDSLHIRSGIPTNKVLELHGNMRDVICSNNQTPLNPVPFGDGSCSYRVPEEEAQCDDCRYFAGVELPLCPKCQCPMRMEAVMFEQPMPEGIVEQAQTMVDGCDLLFVIGSTLIVKPACDLPAVALHNKVPVVLLNYGDHTQYDEYATGLVCAKAGDFMKRVTDILDTKGWHAPS